MFRELLPFSLHEVLASVVFWELFSKNIFFLVISCNEEDDDESQK